MFLLANEAEDSAPQLKAQKLAGCIALPPTKHIKDLQVWKAAVKAAVVPGSSSGSSAAPLAAVLC